MATTTNVGAAAATNVAAADRQAVKEAQLKKDEEAEGLAARREVYEYVLVERRDTMNGGAITSLRLFKDVPRHLLGLFLPEHRLELASSEQVDHCWW